MPAPSFTVIANRDSAEEPGSHQVNPSWCVAFVRYEEPASAYGTQVDLSKTKPLLIVDNDCVSVTISGQKSQFAKAASLQMKLGDVYYPGAIAAGDWVFIWMADYQDNIDRVVSALENLRDTGSLGGVSVNDFESGFKFVGRVAEVGSLEQIAGQNKVVTQRVACQAFTEFLSSVYFTAAAQAFFTKQVGNLNVQTASNLVTNGMDTALSNLGQGFTQFFNRTNDQVLQYPPPDAAIAFYLTVALGINKDNPVTQQVSSASGQGVIGDAVDVPPTVAQILGKPNAKKVWQLLNVYLGVQQYAVRGSDVPTNFAPITDRIMNASQEPVFFSSPYRCKGWVPFYPTPWDNKPLWSVLREYLNSPINEMYTVFRVDQFNKIVPTLMVREQPFGTNLFFQIKNRKVQLPGAKDSTPNNGKTKFSKDQTGSDRSSSSGNQEQIRADYATHPRWVIDESMIKVWDVKTSEANRVNFVQVWGTSTNLDIISPALQGRGDPGAMERYKDQQLAAGNMVADDADIRRHGLRANVEETSLDNPVPGQSSSPFWAKMRADWLLNGHLKAEGGISLNGVEHPICEGDNLEARGIVFHIESVSHQGTIGQDGKREFMTTVQVRNGIMAYSLDTPGHLPAYLPQQGSDPNQIVGLPGATVVNTSRSAFRDSLGDQLPNSLDPNRVRARG